MTSSKRRNKMPTTSSMKELSARELQVILAAPDKCPQLIDVRTALEFDSEHIKGSKNLPLNELGQKDPGLNQQEPVFVICRTGNRAGRAAAQLNASGFACEVLQGGILEWKKSGLPVVEGKKRLSLERQVQLTIGLLILTGVTLGFTVNQLFFLLPGFIGCGLTFAGLTGNCGLAMVLAKAPWNRIDSGSGKEQEGQKSCCS